MTTPNPVIRRARKRKRFPAARRLWRRMTAWAASLPRLQVRLGGGRRARGAGSPTLTVEGAANRSVLVAAREIILQTPLAAIPPMIIGLGVIILVLLATANAVITGMPAKEMFKRGQSYLLDIAVMPFESAAQDAGCRDLARDLTLEVARALSASLQVDAGAAPGAPDAAAYNQNGIKVWFPDQIPLSELTAAGTYAAQAEKLSAERGADIVLYGVVQCDGARLSVTPRFVIAPAYMASTPELHGTYELGPFSGTISQFNASTALAELRSEITQRASAMALLIQGFQYYAYDNQENYLRAADIFSRIITGAARANRQIRAIAEVFLGSANLEAAKGDCQGNIDPVYLEAAQRAYESALADEPQMALAYLGLGYVMNQRAFYLAGDDPAVVMANLNKGREYFNAAEVAAVRPSTSNTAWKVLYGLAQARLIEREFAEDAARANQLLDEAEGLARQMLSTYRANAEAGTAPDSLAALTYMVLGNIQAQRFNSEGARSAYELAARYARNDARLRVQIAVRLAEAKNNLGDVCGAGKHYQQAHVDAACPADKLEYATMARDFEMQCETLAAGE